MAEHLKDILSGLSPDVDQEMLLLYLQNKLSEEKKHEVEKKLLDNQFANDALEGLQQFDDKQRINFLVEQLNNDLRHKLEKKRQRREKMVIKDQPWLYVAVLIILMLIVVGYFVVRKLLLH
jgi:hypothetical protein